MRLHAAALSLAAALANCTAAAPVPVPVGVISIAPAPPNAAEAPVFVAAPVATIAPASAAPELDPAAPAIDGPAVVACLLRAPRWHPRSGPIPLRFSRTGRPYGLLSYGTDAALRIAADTSPDDPILDLDAGGVVLRARVDARAFALHAARPFVIADALIPQFAAAFTWSRAVPGALTLTLGLPVTLKTMKPTTFDRPCADVGFVAQSFQPLAALGGSGLDRAAGLPPGRPVRLRATPGGPTTVELRPGKGDDLTVTVLEQSQGNSRIAWWTGDVVAFGWMASSALVPAPSSGSGMGTGIGLGSIGTVGGAVRCDHEVLLVVEVDGERRTVGRIKPGTHLVTGQHVGEYQRVTLAGVHAQPAPEAVWLVKRAALVGCR